MADNDSPDAVPSPMQDHNRSDIDRRVGRTLKVRRQMVGLTQAELAHESGVSGQQIHKYEAGQSRMTASRLVQLASILEVPVSFFFDGIEDHPHAPSDLLEIMSDPNCLELMMSLRTVKNLSERRRIVDLTRVIIDHEAARIERDEADRIDRANEAVPTLEPAPPVTYLPSRSNGRA